MVQLNLITLTQPTSPASEAYRSLRTNLMLSSTDNSLRTLMVTSALTPDDKAETIANLAVILAQGGNRTILVDTDLRQPRQHSLWGIEGPGLLEMMQDDRLMANPPLATTAVPNLEVLTAGTSAINPADVLSSRRISDIIGVLKARAVYVLFDSPPVLAATDAALLGSRLDGTLLVVKHGKTRRDDVGRAKSALEHVHARIIGVVLTHTAKARSSY